MLVARRGVRLDELGFVLDQDLQISLQGLCPQETENTSDHSRVSESVLRKLISGKARASKNDTFDDIKFDVYSV